MQTLQMTVVLVALCGSLLFAAGCASRERYPASIDSTTSIERPAQPLSEEQSLADRLGEVGVVLLVIGITVGGILLPILLLK